MYEISYNVVEYLVRTCTVCHSCINVLRNRGSRSILLCIMHMKSSNCTGTIVPLHPSSLYPNDRLRLPCNDIHSRVQVDSHVFTVSTMNADVQAVHFAAGLNGDCPLHAANQTFRPILSSLTKQKNRTSDPTIYIMSNLSILSVLVALLIATNATATCLHTFQNCGAGCYNKDNLGRCICSPVGGGYSSPRHDNARYKFASRGSYSNHDEAEFCSIATPDPLVVLHSKNASCVLPVSIKSFQARPCRWHLQGVCSGI